MNLKTNRDKRIGKTILFGGMVPLVLFMGGCGKNEDIPQYDNDVKTEMVSNYKNGTVDVQMKIKNMSKQEKKISYSDKKQPFDLVIENESGQTVFSVVYDSEKLTKLNDKTIETQKEQLQTLRLKPEKPFEKGKYTVKMKDNGTVKGKQLKETKDVFVVKE